MAEIAISGTLASGVTGEITIKVNPRVKTIQVDAADTGTLTVGTKVIGQSGFTVQTTVAQGTILLDMVDVNEIQLAAATGDVDYVVTPVEVYP